jgi:hypothetical protein
VAGWQWAHSKEEIGAVPTVPNRARQWHFQQQWRAKAQKSTSFPIKMTLKNPQNSPKKPFPRQNQPFWYQKTAIFGLKTPI